jgi:hypothetical protein
LLDLDILGRKNHSEERLMTYPVPPAALRRPVTVSAATYLLYLVAVLQIVDVVIALATLSDLKRATELAYQGTVLAGSGSGIAVAGVIGGSVVSLLLATGFVVLGVLDSKGKNPARIITWVLCGLGLCCFGFSSITAAASGRLNFSRPGGPNTPDPAEVARTIQNALPSWQIPATVTIRVLSMLVMLGVAVLLALPASNAFFRRQPPQLDNPPFPTYPTVPPHPGA